jgi:hypothetical protein
VGLVGVIGVIWVEVFMLLRSAPLAHAGGVRGDWVIL